MSLGERIGCIGHNETLDWWGQEEWFQFTAGRRESQSIWKTPHGHSRKLSVCLWGTHRVQILDWQSGYSQTSGELDYQSWPQVFKSSQWMLAFIVMYEVSVLFDALTAAMLSKSLICVWTGSDEQRQFPLTRRSLWTVFSKHIIIVMWFGKIQMFRFLCIVFCQSRQKHHGL